ncbi:SpoIIE family protein phosphatase [Streptomyces sennicomposti]|uniref:SpoIIE family protein phosphatase n=1 Tax=Streptomyces sennicomposti TaxID=2873384 RepID=UPI001CA6B1DF|nr:SpoIIE family protein phosphatase [Streptomyces sennicomposti]MBY8868066.1 SpoIIE family protein phosphatase [Streptomyces sennicomposti]
MSSEPTYRAKTGAAPDRAALAKVVARQRAELDRLRDEAAASAVVERATGALMALTGRGAEAAHEELLRRAKAAGRTPAEEAWLTLGALAPPPGQACDGPATASATAAQGAAPAEGNATGHEAAVTPATAARGVALAQEATPSQEPAAAREPAAVQEPAAVRESAPGREPAVDAAGEAGGSVRTAAVQALFDALPGMTLLLSPLRSATGAVEDFRIDAATPQAVDPAGRRGRELIGLRILECRPTVAGEPLWQDWLDTLDTGEPYTSEPYVRLESVGGGQEPATYSVRAARLDGRLVVTWRRQDASDRQEQLLADLQRLGHLGWATWNLVTGEATWSAQVYALCDRDPGRGPLRLEELADLAVPEDGPALARAVREIRTEGKQFDVPFRIRTAAGDKHLRAVAEAEPDAAGRPVQVHGFVQDLTAQRSAELALLESEQAMVAQHGILQAERMIAGRLQHALLPLPRRPLRLAGLRVDLAYLPAQSGIHVGGDWFSAIELPDGDALFVVGDVAGHGMDAVATMAQLRFTAKGMLFTGSSLTGALTRLNTLLLHSRDSRGTATLVLARYDPERRRLAWAQAGHLPPLLLRGGEARFLDRPRGVLLGATDTPVYEEAECLLEPGDRLLLYTDGLVERPGESIELGLERLARATAAHRSDAPGSLGPLLAALLEGERRDDVCVLDVRVPTEPA